MHQGISFGHLKLLHWSSKICRRSNIQTVYRGIMGYGLSSRINAPRFWELTEKLPIMIEIIDNNEVINEFYNLIEPDLLSMPKGCLVIVEPVTLKLHKPGKH